MDVLTAMLWATIGLAALNTALQGVDLHTTSELIKRGYGREATPWLGKYLNDPFRSWQSRFWLLVAVKFACVAAVAVPAVIAWHLPIHYAPIFFAIEAALAWEYGKQMRLNWSLYLVMTRRIGD